MVMLTYTFVLFKLAFGIAHVLIVAFFLLFLRDGVILPLKASRACFCLQSCFDLISCARSGYPWIFPCCLCQVFVLILRNWCSLAAGFALGCLAVSIRRHSWIRRLFHAFCAQLAWRWRHRPRWLAQIGVLALPTLTAFSHLPHLLLAPFCRVFSFLGATIRMLEALLFTLPILIWKLDCRLTPICENNVKPFQN